MQTLDKYRTPNTNKAMGIEIECLLPEYDENGTYLRPPDYQHIGFFFAGTDGSITPEWRSRTTGREFVSQPLSAPWLRKEIDKLFKKYPWSENHTCGVHIHVSRKWLSEKRAKAIYDFLSTLTEDDRVHLFGRSSNEYCGYTWGITRYSAINIEPEATIEFRVFKSGNNEWCKYCVSMVEYLIAQAYTLNLSAIYAFRDQYKF